METDSTHSTTTVNGNGKEDKTTDMIGGNEIVKVVNPSDSCVTWRNLKKIELFNNNLVYQQEVASTGIFSTFYADLNSFKGLLTEHDPNNERRTFFGKFNDFAFENAQVALSIENAVGRTIDVMGVYLTVNSGVGLHFNVESSTLAARSRRHSSQPDTRRRERPAP